MFLIRQAGPSDFSGLFQLARLLDSYNLPADRGYIRQLLRDSEASFAGKLPKAKAKYLFVLEGKTVPGTLVGCSLIIGKHGTPGRPHLWLGLEKIRKQSRTLGIRRSHQVLRLGYTVNGPTEVGGLVVLPGYRKHPEVCGLQISYVRFLYMGIHPDRFERKILVEYRGAMGAGNKSPFWEAVGRVFTGLPYQKADRLSVTNKEFILNLFPREPIYCALLPESVQEAIGAIHPAARRAAGLLRGIGFRALAQIEPFDGGPYYSADRRRVRLIRQMRRLKAAVIASPGRAKQSPAFLVGTDAGGFFRAVRIRAQVDRGRCFVSREALRLLKLKVGEKVYVCPLSR
ncbi:MAG: arginine N-succinyltransferase [Candidatus Omnitrophica bacterium]|nr:arginine N-succinyltransferase [Candidatus Omnitrophota bacterium]